MFEDELETFTPSSEMEVVYQNNNSPYIDVPCYYPDPINTYNIDGKLIGYT